jgi:hypothetical protein
MSAKTAAGTSGPGWWSYLSRSPPSHGMTVPVNCIPVGGVDRGRPHGAAETAGRGGEPARIPPGDDDP